MRLLALTALLQQGSAQTLKQNSMIFLENYTYAANMPAMHADQVQLASHYNLAIVGWGQDSKDWDSPSFCRNEEEKLPTSPNSSRRRHQPRSLRCTPGSS